MRGSPTPARQQLGPTRFERRGADARKLGHHVWFKLLLAISWLSTTQFSVGATTEYLRRNWLVDDGVPHNVVNRVVQDSAGYLWLATGAGLARFDGRDFQLRPLPERSANMNLNIRDLTTEANGTLLFLPASGGIVRYRDGTFSPHPASAAVAGTSLVDIFAEPNGTLWLGAENETLIRWQDGHSAIFGPADGLKRRGNGFTFAIDQSGRTWVAGGDFCGWYEGGHLHALTDNVGTSVTVAPARSGGVWISSFQHLSKWENGKLATVVESNRWPLARSTVHWMYEDSSGDLWLATRRDGLFHLSGGRVIPVATTSPLVSSVNADRDGNIWVTMEGGGLDRIRPKAFELLDRASGLSEDVSTSVCSDAHGAIWCANRNGGLVRYFAGTTELIAKNDEGSGFFAISLCPDQQDHIWVGTTSGLFRTRASTPYSIETVTTDLSGVRGLFCSKRGDVWVASGDGAWGYFRDSRYHPVLSNTGSSNKRVASMDEDSRGNVWGALRDGTLYEWTEDGLSSERAGSAALPVDRLTAIHFDHDDDLWVSTPHGLFLKSGKEWRSFTKQDGLPDDNVEQILEDDAHRLWLGSRIGLFCLTLDELKNHAANPTAPLTATTFGKDEGLTGATPVGGVQPDTWKAGDGRLWFATHRGLVGLQPDSLSRPHSVPTPYIDEVRIDGQPVASAAPIHIPAGRHRVDFRFVALNFSAPEKIRVRHQLVGVDRDWVETASEHGATYPSLPPGQYEMRMIACNQEGHWGTQVATLVIIADAAWWQTWWAIAAMIAIFTLLIVWLARLWSHRRLKLRLEQLERENALERERARIARDLHDELGGSLTQIRLLAERIKRKADQPEFKSFAGQLAARVRLLGGELESIIWTVSPKNNTLDRLVSFISQYSLKFFRDASMLCVVEGIDHVPPLPLRPEEQHNVLAVTKEALNNVLKHSQASRVTVTVALQDEDFSLTVQDDGVGFDPERADLMTCNGLTNMRTRLREIGGELILKSLLAHGTTVTLHLPLGKNRRPPFAAQAKVNQL